MRRDFSYYCVGVIVGVEVDVDVAVAGALVFVAAPDVTVLVTLPTTMITYTSLPKNCPLAVDMRQLPWAVPAALGAVMATEMSYCAPAAMELGIVTVEPPIAFPPVNANLKPASHAHEPELSTFQVFVKVLPGVICVLSGTVTSLTKVRP